MTKDSKTINFPKEVESAFRFLNEMHFAIASEAPHRVRYESKNVFLEIYYGTRDCEVGIEFGRKHTDERYSFTLFLQLVNSSLEKRMGDGIAYDARDVRKELASLADALMSEGQEILTGSDAIFERMKNVRWWHFQPDALR